MKDFRAYVQAKANANDFDLVIDEDYELSPSATSPSPAQFDLDLDCRFCLRVLPGGAIWLRRQGTPHNNYHTKLKINGPFEACLRKVFHFEGEQPTDPMIDNVLFAHQSVTAVHASWFGAEVVSGDQRFQLGRDKHRAIQRAIYAAKNVATVQLTAGEYLIGDTLHLESLEVQNDEGDLVIVPRPTAIKLVGAGSFEDATAATIIHTRFREARQAENPDQPALWIADRPAIIIRVGWNAEVRRLSIYGDPDYVIAANADGNALRQNLADHIDDMFTDPARAQQVKGAATAKLMNVYRTFKDLLSDLGLASDPEIIATPAPDETYTPKALHFAYLLNQAARQEAGRETPNGSTLKRLSPNESEWIPRFCTSGPNNPFAGIVTDGYHTNHPHSQYGDLERYYNGKGASQDIVISDVSFAHFAAGVVVAAAGSAQNDAIRVERCEFRRCAYGVSVGTSQARANHYQNNSFFECFVAVDNTRFGATTKETGSSINLTSNQYMGCRSLYAIDTSRGGPANIAGDYCEDCYQVGHFGRAGEGYVTSAAAHLSGCHFDLRPLRTHDPSHPWQTYASPRLMIANGPVKFTSCDFVVGNRQPADGQTGQMDHFIHPHAEAEGGSFLFDGCAFITNDSEFFPSVLPSHFKGRFKSTIFRNCVLENKRATSFALSDPQIESIGDPNQRVRTPIILGVRSVAKHSDNDRPSWVDLKYHAQLPLRASIQWDSFKRIDDHTMEFKQSPFTTGQSFYEQDRIFIHCEILDQRLRSASPPASSEFLILRLPVLVVDKVQVGNIDYRSTDITYTASIPVAYRDHIKLPADINILRQWGQTAIPVPLHLVPRSKNTPGLAFPSDIVGQFSAGYDYINVPDLDRIQLVNGNSTGLLEVGDFINQDFVDYGTRIRKVDIKSNRVYISTLATESGSAPIGVISKYLTQR